jgi:predicted permease
VAEPEIQPTATAFFKNLLDKISAVPGVNAAGAINSLPLSNSESLSFFAVDGFANRKDQLAEARSISPKYFSAMGIPLVAGRLFTEDDVHSPAHAVIINQQFAKIYFAGRNPIGAHLSSDENHQHWDTIVGVVADVRHTNLEEPPKPQMYRANYDFGGASLVIRSSLSPALIAAEIRSTLKGIDPVLAITDIHTMADLVSAASARRRFQTSLLTLFAGTALLLALVGLYGLMAYSVSRRTQEVGIRMALGARRFDVVVLVMKDAGRLVGLGLVVGLGSTLLATRVLKSFLFGVSEHDPLTILSVCTLLAVCGLVAAFVPARRAASIDPMQALRTE